MKDLIEELDKALEATKDFGLFKHIFSNDDGEKTLAKLRRTVSKIKFKAKASTLKEYGFPEGKPIRETGGTGKFVKVRPCSEEYKDKTFIGVLIGDAALSSEIDIKDDAIVCRWAFYNPAILVPELGKVVYGCESWWGEINTPHDLEDITDIDIDNVWYVKALKQLQST